MRIMGLAYGRQHGSIEAAHRAQLSFFNAEQLQQLGLEPEALQQPRANGAIRGSVDDAIRLDIEDYMPANNLARTDRASMAHGLELRAPFLDVEFASFCLSLPYRLKVSTREDKIILRRSFASQWPNAIRNRSKQGFGAPVARWLGEPSIRELENEYVHAATAPLYDVVSRDGARALWPRCDAMQRWTLLVLATWLSRTRGTWRTH
jgi:asparagine synthase (glutamine-hydrolysing)